MNNHIFLKPKVSPTLKDIPFINIEEKENQHIHIWEALTR